MTFYIIPALGGRVLYYVTGHTGALVIHKDKLTCSTMILEGVNARVSKNDYEIDRAPPQAVIDVANDNCHHIFSQKTIDSCLTKVADDGATKTTTSSAPSTKTKTATKG